MARSLRGDHDDVEVLARNDLRVVDVKAVGKSQGCAFLDVGFDLLVIHIGDEFVGQQNHHDIGALGRFFDGLDGKAGILSLGPGRTALAKTDDNVAARVVQVQGVCVTLAAVADNCDSLTL